jgi:hypothetical protein
MKHGDFLFGEEFQCGDLTYKVTDIGTRTIIAIRVDEVLIERFSAGMVTPVKQTLKRSEAEEQGWFNGPPYAVEETVFDENDIEECSTVGQ